MELVEAPDLSRRSTARRGKNAMALDLSLAPVQRAQGAWAGAKAQRHCMLFR